MSVQRYQIADWLLLTELLYGRLQKKLETAEEELFEVETKWTAAKMRVQQLRVQARSAEEMAQRTRSSAQVKPPLPLQLSLECLGNVWWSAIAHMPVQV